MTLYHINTEWTVLDAPSSFNLPCDSDGLLFLFVLRKWLYDKISWMVKQTNNKQLNIFHLFSEKVWFVSFLSALKQVPIVQIHCPKLTEIEKQGSFTVSDSWQQIRVGAHTHTHTHNSFVFSEFFS